MQRVKGGLLTFLIIILFTSLGVAADKSTNHHSFEASLSGNEAVPPVQTKAKGEAKFQFSKGGIN